MVDGVDVMDNRLLTQFVVTRVTDLTKAFTTILTSVPDLTFVSKI